MRLSCKLCYTICTYVGVFVNKRVIIAVTQFDKTFSPVVEHNQMTEEEAKRIVCGMIKSSTGFKASQDLVIPVCSMWAFVARKFRHVPNDGRFRQYIRSELEKCPGPRGQQENPEELGPALLADRLEEESGIDILEERLSFSEILCNLFHLLLHQEKS